MPKNKQAETNTQTQKQNKEGLTEIVEELVKMCEEHLKNISEGFVEWHDYKTIFRLDLCIDNIETTLTLICKACKKDSNFKNNNNISFLKLLKKLSWRGTMAFNNYDIQNFNEEDYFIKITKNEDKNTYDVCKDDVECFILKTFNNLNNLKFDKIHNKFCDNDKFNFYNKIVDYFNLNRSGVDECCICNDKTTLVTSCNHHLCFQCLQKIKIYNINNDDEFLCFKCPMCRRKVEHMKLYGVFNYASDHSEYEDEN